MRPTTNTPTRADASTSNSASRKRRGPGQPRSSRRAGLARAPRSCSRAPKKASGCSANGCARRRTSSPRSSRRGPRPGASAQVVSPGPCRARGARSCSPPGSPRPPTSQGAGREARRPREGQGVGPGRAGASRASAAITASPTRDSALGRRAREASRAGSATRRSERLQESQRRLDATSASSSTARCSEAGRWSHGFDLGIG